MKGWILATVALGLSTPVASQIASLQRSPELGVETTVPAGGIVYSFMRVYTIDGARLNASSGPGSYIRGRTVEANTDLVPVKTKSFFKACVPAPGTFEPEGPCFMDDDGDGRFDRQATNDYNIAAKLKVPVPYVKVPISVTREDSFKRVILFQGSTSDSLRFSYREFSNDMARPAFTEELTVPREPFPSMIMIKDLQLEVLGVSGMGMRYRVIRGY